MAIAPRPHPLERLSWSERLRGAAGRRRTRQGLDALQLRILRAAAAHRAEVYDVGSVHLGSARGGTSAPGCGSGRIHAIEISIGERRLVGRVSAEAEDSLRATLRSGPVAFTDAGRYGPYWTLAFEAPCEVLIVLAEGVVLRPGPGGRAGDRRVPALRAGG